MTGKIIVTAAVTLLLVAAAQGEMPIGESPGTSGETMMPAGSSPGTETMSPAAEVPAESGVVRVRRIGRRIGQAIEIQETPRRQGLTPSSSILASECSYGDTLHHHRFCSTRWD